MLLDTPFLNTEYTSVLAHIPGLAICQIFAFLFASSLSPLTRIAIRLITTDSFQDDFIYAF